jgi:hypothetical protein
MSRFLSLHAGGIVRGRKAILLVGPGGAGKTTLVVRFVSAGFHFLSDDEIKICVKELKAYPSPRELFLKGNAPQLFPKLVFGLIPEPAGQSMWWLDPQAIRKDCVSPPTEVWGFIFLCRQKTLQAKIRQLSQAEGLSRLFAECMNFPDVKRAGFDALVDLTSRCPMLEVTYWDLEECFQALQEVIPDDDH